MFSRRPTGGSFRRRLPGPGPRLCATLPKPQKAAASRSRQLACIFDISVSRQSLRRKGRIASRLMESRYERHTASRPVPGVRSQRALGPPALEQQQVGLCPIAGSRRAMSAAQQRASTKRPTTPAARHCRYHRRQAAGQHGAADRVGPGGLPAGQRPDGRESAAKLAECMQEARGRASTGSPNRNRAMPSPIAPTPDSTSPRRFRDASGLGFPAQARQ